MSNKFDFQRFLSIVPVRNLFLDITLQDQIHD